MKYFACLLVLVILAPVSLLADTETSATSRITVNLVDGSRIIGIPDAGTMAFQTEFGKIDLPINKISRVNLNRDDEAVTIDLLNGDRMKGTLGFESYTLVTLVGELTIQAEDINTISFHSTSLPKKGLLLHYSFDKDGKHIKDLSGKGHKGTVHGATWVADGVAGGAFLFDGKDDYVSTPHADDLEVADALTMMAWVNYQSDGIGSSGMIIGKYNSSKMHYAMGRYTLAYRSPHAFFVGLKTGGWTDYVAPGKIDDKKWNHLAATYDRKAVRFYLNGKLAHTVDQSRALKGGEGPLEICRDPNPDWIEFTHAYVDEVAIYSRALSAKELASYVDGLAPPAQQNQ